MRLKRFMTLLLAALLLTGCRGVGETEHVIRITGDATPSAVPPATVETAGPSPRVTAAPENPSDAFVIRDMAGREVRLTKKAKKTIALSPAGCEILFALGAEETLIGRNEGCDYPPEAVDLPAFALESEADASRIIARQPDLVLLDRAEQREDRIAQLEQAGIPVVICGGDTVEDAYACLRLLGRLYDASDRAEQIIRAMQDAFAAIQAVPLEGGKTIYFEMETESGLRTAGRGTFLNDIAEMMGLRNCFDDVAGWAEVTVAQVTERDPDFILTVTPYAGEGAAPEEELVCRDAWQNVTAVRNLAVFGMPDNELSRIGPRLAEGAQILYDFVVESQAAME